MGNYVGSPDLGTGPLPYVLQDPYAWGRALFIAKFAPDGRTVWARGFLAKNEPGGEWPMPVFPDSVTTDAQGSLIVTGHFRGWMDLGGGNLFAGEQTVEPDSDSAWTGGFLAKFSWEGRHLWSKALPNSNDYARSTRGASVAMDGTGHILLSGSASLGTDLGDGPLAEPGPFIAKYDASGTLQWKRVFAGVRGCSRVFAGASGAVTGVRSLGAQGVGFISLRVGRTFRDLSSEMTKGASRELHLRVPASRVDGGLRGVRPG